ncbi:non-heme iron oxygenase ferredoxin subunit [Kamptonema cortianum]|uniref:Non-heme iron oxygenase ferredoxin subunit n=1 Tax=Geitlerinema calcuttense NRMC-F 0142 TaxID=2922238 RepID=A0ABT7M0Q8_9CYAN|nr:MULTISPECIES: non-heme iron oxygenase ferredoxin subunit [Cyanophyceae]MDK3161900.1 non-heme iron oxygenase ferredoxin subunit [Kamptonema cortianum]MDL5050575.1 non-heme iron oxygenase ferredoxin subunit [Oscillatoria amoena NRMC-F 0135]MDL5055591.1 non-heme iron oxygenase ferredoxin subunit [Oscillatoria laete-virens NRMC-F 0139]MDL5057843.1 non-heme iron oxygenase ferredoxin subunit [Geitlerinema calcuttense NRMC-F 0142]
MGEFIKIGTVNDIPPGKCKGINLQGEDIGIYNVDGQFCAMENTCPHMGAPLSQGHVKDGVVMCPLHMWKFDVKTGKSLTAPGADLQTFEIKVEGGDIFLKKE